MIVLTVFFPSFDNLYKELSSGFCLVDNFPNCFFFHTVNCKDKDIMNTHIHNLDNIFENSLLDPKTIVVISDISVKNSVTTSISHVHYGSIIQAKTIHYAINVTSTEAELFAVRCSINQVHDVIHIIIITNAIHLARRIFDSSLHSYQLQSITISQDLRVFFNKNSNNSIDFWNFPSSVQWNHYSVVDKETKQFKYASIFPCKSSWNFNKKEKSDSIINK